MIYVDDIVCRICQRKRVLPLHEMTIRGEMDGGIEALVEKLVAGDSSRVLGGTARHI